MTFLPIVARELRVAARRRGTYWFRAGIVTALILFGIWFFLMMAERPPQDIAQGLFGALSISCVIYGWLRGIGLTSDCLSEEKREGTLGLLFLTDLRGYDVVLGKLVATSLNALYGVLGVLPILAIPLLLGGLTPEECGRMGLVAVNTLFLSLAIGMGVSAVSRSGRKAKLATTIILVGLTGGFPLMAVWPAFLGKSTAPLEPLMMPSVGYTYYQAWESVYKLGGAPFWWSLGIVHAIGWCSLLFACVAAPHSWQDRSAGAPTPWRERWHTWSYGENLERTAFRRRLLDTNAFFWLIARARLRPAYVWGALAIIACIWAWGIAKFQRDWLNQTMYIFTALILNAGIKCWFASEAGRQLAEDRKLGALELLLTTPLSLREILRGQMLALKRQFLGPVLAILGVEFLFLLSSPEDSPSERADTVLFWLGMMLMLLADLVAMFWVGLWQALTAKSPSRAVSVNIGLILGLPWTVLGVIVLAVALGGLNDLDVGSFRFFILLWFVTGISVDFLFVMVARHRLISGFRQIAVQRFISRRQGNAGSAAGRSRQTAKAS